jgi:hypothetical protein
MMSRLNAQNLAATDGQAEVGDVDSGIQTHCHGHCPGQILDQRVTHGAVRRHADQQPRRVVQYDWWLR